MADSLLQAYSADHCLYAIFRPLEINVGYGVELLLESLPSCQMTDRTYLASTLERELQDSIILLERLRTAEPLVAHIALVQRSVS